MIIVTGAVVRVTGSGLGCPTWPNCTTDTFAPTAEMGLHGIIEFGNRVLTGALCAVVGWLIVVARLQREPVPGITRWAWAQFWIIILNAVIGGVTVLAGLSPYIVAAHFLAAVLLLTAATGVWHKVHQIGRARSEAAKEPAMRRLASILLVMTAGLLVIGTVATGSGPHAGDSAEVARMPIDWAAATIAHGVVAVFVLVVALWLAFKLRQRAGDVLRLRINVFIVVFLGQGLVGLIQSLTSLPELAVVLHLLGSALVWIGAIRVYLDSRPAPVITEINDRDARPAVP